MADLHAFFDRDIFLKLACCDLWEDAIKALAVTHAYRLASTSSVRRAVGALSRMGFSIELLEITVERLDAMVASTEVLPEDWAIGGANVNLLNKLNDTPAIDPGEALLTVTVMNCPHENRLVTGDKRFVSALREGFPAEYEALRPRLITFERCLLACVQCYGFEYVKGKTVPALTCDGSLKIAINYGMDTEEKHFIDALESFDPLKT